MWSSFCTTECSTVCPTSSRFRSPTTESTICRRMSSHRSVTSPISCFSRTDSSSGWGPSAGWFFCFQEGNRGQSDGRRCNWVGKWHVVPWNRLEFVWPRTFVGLKSLRRLSVAGNRLTSLPEAALRHSPSLSYVDLAENNFRSIERCAFPVSTSGIRTLSIVGNPVVCNCSLAWLAVAKDHTSRVVWGTCRQPRHLAESFAQNGADIMIDSVVKLANTCTDFDVPDCRFD